VALRSLSTSEAVRDARRLPVTGRGIVEPALTTAVVRATRRRSPGRQIARTGAGRRRRPREGVERRGRSYSDLPVLIGKRLRLGADDLHALRTDRVGR
jgi:hypothetical protein